MDFQTLFKNALAADISPYPYQARLALEPWPPIINIPTGMGKTAAVILSWLYKRYISKEATPRRLIYCLPMRVLVQQTCLNAKGWIDNLVRAGIISPEKQPEVSILMGGEIEQDWDFQPEKELILVGTQDQLLSRAMNRGYAMSRFRWPVHFALLNNDSLWIMDETQLMGVALKTTAQLQAFRDSLKTLGRVQSIWMSATLDEKSLDTVDHRRPEGGWPSLSLSQTEIALPEVKKRIEAKKQLFRADTVLGADESAYSRRLAAEILEKHISGCLTLVVVNRVSRAQQVYRSLLDAGRNQKNTGLIHSRFREPDRGRHEKLLFGEGDRIIVATQTIEAGVDVSARVLFTETAPWPSLVQRFGRLNRYGEHAEATAYWISLISSKDLENLLQKENGLSRDKAQKKAANVLENCSIPYPLSLLQESSVTLSNLKSVDIVTLQRVDYTEPETIQPVIRRKDIIELFDTSADLSGSDLDISRYIRDQEDNDVQVYWRDFEGETPSLDQPAPLREELCAVSLAGIKDFLRKKEVIAWRWDHLDAVWQQIAFYEILPGMVLLFKTTAGGYDPFLGWTGVPAKAEQMVPGVETRDQSDNECMEEGRQVLASRWLTIAEHAQDVATVCQSLTAALEVPDEFLKPLTTAAWWHDVGKAHEQFQMVLARLEGFQPGLWAKAGGNASDQAASIFPEFINSKRRYFRHELASALAYLQQAQPDNSVKDLIAYLIASHHGKIRLRLRSLPGETKPTDPETPHACGVWQGDLLPAVDLGDGLASVETNLDLSPMLLGEGEFGSSWLQRMITLRDSLGPFRLAYLEALLRIADWRASAAE